MKTYGRVTTLTLGMTAMVALAGCHNYVKRSEFDATVSELRGTDMALRDDVELARAETREQVASLGRDLEGKLKNQEVAITDLQDKLRLDLTAHFDFDKANLREQDKVALSDFADVVKQRPAMQVTVEGFADAAGSRTYNQKLGQKRAEAVREQLIQEGLPAEKVKAVSYGSDPKRQIEPGAWGSNGQENRRVALVVEPTNVSDQVGANTSQSVQGEQVGSAADAQKGDAVASIDSADAKDSKGSKQ